MRIELRARRSSVFNALRILDTRVPRTREEWGRGSRSGRVEVWRVRVCETVTSGRRIPDDESQLDVKGKAETFREL